MKKNEEQEYAEKMLEQGVDVPELEEEATPQEEEEKPEEESEESEGQSQDEPEEEEEESEKEPLQEPKEKKRSIYDDFKDNKKELKSTKETLTQIQAERDELAQKLSNFKQASTPEEISDAQDEIDEFAQSINADPETIRKMQALFLKGVKPSIDPALQKDLEEFKSYKAQNQEAIQKQMFDDRFNQSKPALKELFPKANSDELETIKTELADLSKEEEWQGKDLDFIAFKNKTALSALVSPRKKGMESKNRQLNQEGSDFEFNPNADISTLSPAQQELWEKEYNKASKKAEGLMTGPDGKKSIL